MLGSSNCPNSEAKVLIPISKTLTPLKDNCSFGKFTGSSFTILPNLSIPSSTEEPCAVISLGSEADTNKAVDAARSAFEGWMFTPKNDRLKLIENILEEYNDRPFTN